MSSGAYKKDDLFFIFVGHRGLQIGTIFFELIKEDYKGKRYDILNFFSHVFFICETEEQFRRIGALIEGYIPEENVLLLGELNTSGDLWSNIEENDDIFANRLFAPLMFAVDQTEKPNILLFYDLSNGKQAGICDYLLQNFPLVKQYMPIYIIATTSIDEGAGALSIYWSILGLNSIIEGKTARACILLDYEAIGNSIYLSRIKKMDEINFESYNYVVANLIYSLTYYDREPYSNSVPFCQLIDKLVLFNEMKFIIPFMTMPRRELIEDETFSGYLNELVNDCNLFSMSYKRPLDEDGNVTEVPKISLANAFMAFGEKQDTEYLNLIRNNLPPIMDYLPGSNTFYTYPRGDPFSIFLENNTVVRQYFQDLVEKFDILISHHSYLHVLEDLGLTRESFVEALDKLISLVDAYQECEDLLYDEEEFDYEEEIQKYSAAEEKEEDYEEKYGDKEQSEQNIEETDDINTLSENKSNKQTELKQTTILDPIDNGKFQNQKQIDDQETSPKKIDANSIMQLNETSIKSSIFRKALASKSPQSQEKTSLVSRGGVATQSQSKKETEEDGALKWLEMRASKEKEKVTKEKEQVEKDRDEFIRQKQEFEETQEMMRLEEEKRKLEEQEKTKKKKDELKELAKMFDNL